jgi:hypothetical protein
METFTTLDESVFQQYLKEKKYPELSCLLLEDALERLRQNTMHPYLRQQVQEACLELLTKEKNRSLEQFRRGLLLATQVVSLAVAEEVEAANYRNTFQTSQNSDALIYHQTDN